MYDRTSGALVPIGMILTNMKPKNLDTEWKNERKQAGAGVVPSSGLASSWTLDRI